MNLDKINFLAQPILTRFQELEKIISDPFFPQNPQFAELSKEHNSLSQKISLIQTWRKLNQELNHLSEMTDSNDPEMVELAQAEKVDLQAKIQKQENDLLASILPRDPNEDRNVILEVRAGTGGEEAALFAQEVARMYIRFAESLGFTYEILSGSLSDRGGFKEAIFMVQGKSRIQSMGAFGFFKYEKGVHRVQRVPETETNGRIHTSTITVAVLPEVEEVDVEVKTEDLKIDTYRASGAGGQHINKTESAIRITHLPSGIVVACQMERSQIKNRATAMKMLRAKLFQIAEENQSKKIADDRKKQVGTGERSEKIRTYNFPQDRITDHRIGFSMHHIQEVLEGHLLPIVEALQQVERHRIESVGFLK